MTAHKWTTDAPTESGHYWAKAKGFSAPLVVFFDCTGSENWQVEAIGSEIGGPTSEYTHWMRIDAPEQPK